MKIIIISILALFLTSCGMTNDEIISETKKCHVAGLGTLFTKDGWTSSNIIKVQCIPYNLTEFK